VRRTFRKRDEKFFVERREPAFNSAQAQTAFARDGPVRKTECEIVKRLGFEFSQQRSFERILERRIDHVSAVFQHRGDEAQEARLRIVLMNEAIGGGWIDGFNDLANLVDVDLVRKL